MKTIFTIFTALFFLGILQGQELPAKEAYPFDVKQIHSGHSLTDPLFYPWPGQYVNLMTKQRGTWAGDSIGKSTIPGSSMEWRWNNRVQHAPDARHDIADWELLVITEGVPLYYEGGGTHQWYIDAIPKQRQQLSTWVNHAWDNGNRADSLRGASTLLWTTWTNIDDSDGPWREMLDTLGQEWENMRDYANEHRPEGAPPVYIIPGHKMMAKLYDDIQAGLVPEVTSIDTFFSDNIHMSELGSYAVAMIHYACIYNRSPIGLTNDLRYNPGREMSTLVSPELTTYLQTMIWSEVTNYPGSGVQRSTLPVDFVSFDADKDDEGKVHLAWETASEKNNEVFVVERSTDGSRWSEVTRVAGSGDSNTRNRYIATDDIPLDGLAYYRIKQVDYDGLYTYSTVENVTFHNNRSLTIYPNPAIDYITMEGNPSELHEVRIYNMLGQDVTNLTTATTLTEKKKRIHTSLLLTGMYFVRTSTGSQILFKN